ncbi:MAG: SDR family NAD(P)-dependent oxidoreductase [Nannocystaceae bacterium]
MRWSERRVLVTGASRGIGRAAAEGIAARGATVVLAARAASGLEEVARAIEAKGGRAERAVMDVSDDDSVEAAAREVLARGPVHVVVNNAGVFDQRPFLAQPAETQRRELEVNYFGALRVTRALLPAMLERREGLVVNVSSMVGAIPCPTVANYSASKAALEAWTHALRGEVAGRGVQVMVFRPSHTDTEQARTTTTFDGVPMMTVEYTVGQLLRAIERRPRVFTVSPVFRLFVRLAAIFPAWGERQMARSTARRLREHEGGAAP